MDKSSQPITLQLEFAQFWITVEIIFQRNVDPIVATCRHKWYAGAQNLKFEENFSSWQRPWFCDFLDPMRFLCQTLGHRVKQNRLCLGPFCPVIRVAYHQSTWFFENYLFEIIEIAHVGLLIKIIEFIQWLFFLWNNS